MSMILFQRYVVKLNELCSTYVSAKNTKLSEVLMYFFSSLLFQLNLLIFIFHIGRPTSHHLAKLKLFKTCCCFSIVNSVEYSNVLNFIFIVRLTYSFGFLHRKTSEHHQSSLIRKHKKLHNH